MRFENVPDTGNTDASSLLLPHQRKAVDHVRETARGGRAEARTTVRNILARAGVGAGTLEEALASLRAHGRIALHFHPERLSEKGQSVVQGLLQDGVYKNQYETGLSSGSPTAFSGGDRDLWEKRLFGGAYHTARATPADRPKYGSVEIMDYPDGPSPRFGSCYLLLRPDVSGRSTFTWGGSQEDLAPERTGTLDELETVMAALLDEVREGHGALGVPGLTVAALLAHIAHPPDPDRDRSTAPLGRALDSFMEAQVHGTIRMARDVECIIADPCFRGKQVEQVLLAICARYRLPLHWHPGFTLPVADVPDEFRGYPVRPLAARIAGRGLLDAATIGAAANTLQLEPAAWKGWAEYDDILTQFRRLWHMLVLYGRPNRAAQGAG